MSLRVAVFGANGKVGRYLCNKLKQSGKYEPLAIIRKEEQKQSFANDGINAQVVSVEDSSVGTIAKALKGSHAVVFTAGAGGNGPVERTFLVDLDGAVKTMEASEEASVSRYIMVSAFKAEDREAWWDGPLRNYYIAKRHADQILRGTKLDYTIFHPAALLDGAGVGTAAAQSKALEAGKDNWKIHREDVATAIVEGLKNDSTIGKTIPLVLGDLPIAEAITK